MRFEYISGVVGSVGRVIGVIGVARRRIRNREGQRVNMELCPVESGAKGMMQEGNEKRMIW